MIYWVIGTAISTAFIIWMFYEAKNAPTVVDSTTMHPDNNAKVESKKGEEDESNSVH